MPGTGRILTAKQLAALAGGRAVRAANIAAAKLSGDDKSPAKKTKSTARKGASGSRGGAKSPKKSTKSPKRGTSGNRRGGAVPMTGGFWW